MSKPKTRKKPARAAAKPQWHSFTSSLAPDPRQSDKSRDPQRFVHALILKDDRGRLWEKLGKQPPALIEDPPEE